MHLKVSAPLTYKVSKKGTNIFDTEVLTFLHILNILSAVLFD